MGELAKIESFRREVAIVETWEDIKIAETKGAALAEIARRMNIAKDKQDDLGILRTELERKKGEKLDELFPSKVNKAYRDIRYAEMPVTPDESANARKINNNWNLAEEVMSEIAKTSQVITPQKVAIEIRKKEKEKERQQKSEEGKKIKLDIDFRLGDCETVFNDISDGSIDCIITDPPYPYEFIECWSKLSKLAKRLLKPNGFCIAYSGHIHLPEVIQRMSENLFYYWTFCLIHSGTNQLAMGRNIYAGWKPVLVFQNGFKKLDNPVYDLIHGTGTSKKYHIWEQAEDELKEIIENFTLPGQKILDPFVGSGTTLIAAKKSGRIPIGSEIDEITYNNAKARIFQ